MSRSLREVEKIDLAQIYTVITHALDYTPTKHAFTQLMTAVVEQVEAISERDINETTLRQTLTCIVDLSVSIEGNKSKLVWGKNRGLLKEIKDRMHDASGKIHSNLITAIEHGTFAHDHHLVTTLHLYYHASASFTKPLAFRIWGLGPQLEQVAQDIGFDLKTQKENSAVLRSELANAIKLAQQQKASGDSDYVSNSSSSDNGSNSDTPCINDNSGAIAQPMTETLSEVALQKLANVNGYVALCERLVYTLHESQYDVRANDTNTMYARYIIGILASKDSALDITTLADEFHESGHLSADARGIITYGYCLAAMVLALNRDDRQLVIGDLVTEGNKVTIGESSIAEFYADTHMQRLFPKLPPQEAGQSMDNEVENQRCCVQ